ncbi:unnamed protein product [Rotaria sp. Silwood1]|nr:unnamed protein product [Rotaria sp. Silwood1]CAF1078044.1 unnamed protein product [Rotaria sp. Silwood1]CAF3409795.1 unnamed protein product [Rotaria sp. Silwood1]CAF3437350.1 unnamed protein product [Rotaria sp. Silwood1]CAF3439056.1 unnamed protein product [Rotaria sp. Silwood1]
MFLCAPCKINLTLDVFDKKERTDGYHNLDSLVVPLGELADELHIHIEPASDRTSIILTCNDSYVPVDNRNLAYRAAEAYLANIDKSFHIQIDLYKRIPAEAGLGGGSSDAAAVLRALNAYFNQAVDQSVLTVMAARLGSDVPLFLAEKPVRMRGCGDIIESLDFELPVFWGVIVHPGTRVSTAHAYALLDAVPNRQSGTSTERLLSRLSDKKDMSSNISELLATSLSNDFESVVFVAYPNVARAYEMIISAGALRALLCGSGSAIFGLARDLQHANNRNMTSKQTRVGMGFDVHRFLPTQNGPSNKIMLCGVEIPSTFDIEANSDGDVGLHALVDALLGSVAAGDIGMHFAPDDKQWTGAKSSVFLKHALMIVHEKGGELINIDITIIAEKPYISPYRQIMREKLSELLALNIERISVKATTTEKMGFIGREEGIAAQAIISVLV